MRPWPARSLVVVIVAALLAGCGMTPRGVDAANALEAIFPTLESRGVTAFARGKVGGKDCEYFVYERGVVQSFPDCGFDVLGPTDRAPLDETARADLDAIYHEAERHGARLISAYPVYRDGAIVGGEFSIESCRWYTYHPGWGRLPDGDSEVHTAVNADWYETSCF